jgi:hypothetical protein
MSYSHSHPAFDHHSFLNGHCLSPPASEPAAANRQADRAIDSELRSVPLPDGLMTRLGTLVYTMSEESTDHVDWLGC